MSSSTIATAGEATGGPGRRYRGRDRQALRPAVSRRGIAVVEVQGTCDERFARRARRLRRQLRRRVSTSAPRSRSSTTASWSSTSGPAHADEAGTAPWERDTITNVWSTTKTMAALCAPDARRPRRARPPRARRPLLAGVRRQRQGRPSRSATCSATRPACPAATSRSPRPTSATGRSAPSLLAAQAPWWEPGTASGYHAFTQGYLDRRDRPAHHRASRSARSSPRRSPGRSVPTSTSGCPPRPTPGCRT